MRETSRYGLLFFVCLLCVKKKKKYIVVATRKILHDLFLYCTQPEIIIVFKLAVRAIKRLARSEALEHGVRLLWSELRHLKIE